MAAPTPEPRLHVETRGDGPAIVFAHGFGGSARNFRPQAKALSDRFRVIAYDARGHARSEAPEPPEAYELARLADDFLRVARESGSSTIIAAGLSLGSATALAAALREPAAFTGLVLASPPAGSSDPGRRTWALEFAEAIETEGLEKAGESFAWGARSRFDPSGAKLIRQGFLEHPPQALAAILRHTLAELPGPDALAGELRALDLPVLIVAGSEDRGSLPPAEKLAELVPGARLLVIEGAGHVVNLAAADAFNEAVREFVGRLSAPPGEGQGSR